MVITILCAKLSHSIHISHSNGISDMFIITYDAHTDNSIIDYLKSICHSI